MTEKRKMTTVFTRIKAALTIVQNDVVIDTMRSADYITTICKSVMLHLSVQDCNRL